MAIDLFIFVCENTKSFIRATDLFVLICSKSKYKQVLMKLSEFVRVYEAQKHTITSKKGAKLTGIWSKKDCNTPSKKVFVVPLSVFFSFWSPRSQ